MTAKELGATLETEHKEDLRVWLGRLQVFGLAGFAGRTRAMRYVVEPALLSSTGLGLPTTLLRIEPYRLRALVRISDQRDRPFRHRDRRFRERDRFGVLKLGCAKKIVKVLLAVQIRQ